MKSEIIHKEGNRITRKLKELVSIRTEQNRTEQNRTSANQA
jgi:hypothetical protein